MLPSQSKQRELSSEHEMLLHIRDTLYEGNWDDFAADLTARAESRPHVYDVLPPSSRMGETISRHLVLIDELRAWETSHKTTLRPRGTPAA